MLEIHRDVFQIAMAKLLSNLAVNQEAYSQN